MDLSCLAYDTNFVKKYNYYRVFTSYIQKYEKQKN